MTGSFKARVIGATLIGALFVFTASAFAQRAASTNPPTNNGVTRQNAPQFIVIGSDDNTCPLGVKWMADFVRDSRNARNQRGFMSFYVNTDMPGNLGWARNEALRTAVKNAYLDGHSIGNHTATHIRCVGGSDWNAPEDGNHPQNLNIRKSDQEIYDEIIAARNAMAELGIPVEHQFGFRTPFLAYSDSTYIAIMNAGGFLYDVSINSRGVPGNVNWPYTLDIIPGQQDANDNGNVPPDNHPTGWGGHSDKNPIRAHPGLWVKPIMGVLIHPDDRPNVWRPRYMFGGGTTDNPCSQPLTPFNAATNDCDNRRWDTWHVAGLDYNIWGEIHLTAQQSLRALIYTLETSLAGNRAPMTYGTHAQYYFEPDDKFDEVVPTASGGTFNYSLTAEQRRWVFEEFVKVASAKPDVFFVTGDMVIRWMQNPVPAAQFNPEDYRVGGSGGPIVTCPNCGQTNCDGTCQTANSEFLQLIGWEWVDWQDPESSYHDNYGGSSVTVTSQSPLTATLTLGTPAHPSDGPWPYIGLGAWPGSFAQLSQVEITYTSNAAFRLAIGLSNVSVSDPVVDYVANLPAASTPTTVTLQLSQFVAPTYPPKDFNGPENLGLANKSDMSGITFTHINYGETVNFTVTSLKLFGVSGGSVSIAQQPRSTTRAATGNALRINGFRAGNLSLNVGTAGMYQVSLHDVSGRMISQTQANLVRGANNIPIGQNLARGVVIVKIEGANSSLVRRISVR